MFEPVADLWKQYQAKSTTTWPAGDPRHGLSGEVLVRLGQLDLTLEHCRSAIAAIDVDPEDRKRTTAFALEAQPKFARGEMSEEEYVAGIRSRTSRKDLLRSARAFEEVVLFTEMFYVVAFRLIEILNAPDPRRFVGIKRIGARGVSRVRNVLIIHPEHRKDLADYTQTMMITDDGPTLKTAGAVVRGLTLRVEALEDSLDRGFVR